MKRTLPKRETETENYPHTVSRRCPFSSHGLHDPWELIDAEEEEKCYIKQQQQQKRENDDAETKIASYTQLVQETCSQSKTPGRSKTENERKNTAEVWLIDEEISQNPNPNPNLDFSGNDVTLPNFIGKQTRPLLRVQMECGYVF